MATQTQSDTEPRIPLSRDRVLRTAVSLSDRAGIESLTMRNLAHELGVEAMSLYYHVANKEAVLDGVVEVIVGEILESVDTTDGPSSPGEWKMRARRRILTAREVMLRHRWAPKVFESRTTMSPTTMTYFDGLLGILLGGGFSYDLAHHAMHVLGSRALGFTQELFEPDETETAGGDDDVAELMEQMADQLPNLVGMLTEISHDDPDSTLGWCDDQLEFEFGLDLILDGLDRLRQTS